MATKVRSAALEKRLKRIGPKARQAIRKVLEQSADELVAQQKHLVPVRTGRLRDSIVATFGGDAPAYSQFRSGTRGDPDLSVVISAGNSRVRYAHLVEFGAAPHEAGGMFEGAQHPGAPAQPFFLPPYRLMRKKVARKIKAAVRKAAKLQAAGG